MDEEIPTAAMPLGDTELITVQVEKDLGIQIDQNLKFRQRAAMVVAKACQILAAIHQSFALIDAQTLPTLSKSLVRPIWNMGIWCRVPSTGQTKNK